MPEGIGYCKNVRMRPAGNGWVVQYDRYDKSKMNEYDGLSLIGQIEEVFEDSTDATDRAEEIYNSDLYLPKANSDKETSSMKYSMKK